jgi:outer membrane protein assembly factor BamD
MGLAEARLKRLGALALLVALAACASGEVDLATLASNSDQLIWEAGQKAFEKHQWEAARQHFRRIIDAFPQSEFAPAARLNLADSHFGEGGAGNYILAVSEYRDFVTLYPSHPKSDYAQFQTGESYYKQKNGPDRDQAPTQKALTEFERFLDLYPNSSFVEKAKERIRECRQSLARAEFLAGYFYQRTRRAYRASILRYQGILTNYPDYEELDEVLFRLGECLILAGRKAEALPHLQQLLDTYPQSPRLGEAQKLILEAQQAPPTPGTPGPTPSPSPTPPPS